MQTQYRKDVVIRINFKISTNLVMLPVIKDENGNNYNKHHMQSFVDSVGHRNTMQGLFLLLLLSYLVENGVVGSACNTGGTDLK